MDHVILLEVLKNIKPCPSGLPHNIVNKIVTNTFGHKFCCHTDCVRANMDEVLNGGKR